VKLTLTPEKLLKLILIPEKLLKLNLGPEKLLKLILIPEKLLKLSSSLEKLLMLSLDSEKLLNLSVKPQVACAGKLEFQKIPTLQRPPTDEIPQPTSPTIRRLLAPRRDIHEFIDPAVHIVWEPNRLGALNAAASKSGQMR
jgi:hypothetical protein